MVRDAFSMIELVFAIVIMAIVLLAVPSALIQTTKGVEETLKQEVVFYGARAMGAILPNYWDEKSVDQNDSVDQNEGNVSRILDVVNGDNELNRTSIGAKHFFRIGNFGGKVQRRFFKDVTLASSIGKEGSEYNDIDDFDGNTTNISGSENDFAINISIHKKIQYVSDSSDFNSSTISFTFGTTPQNQSTNIKMIELNVTDKSGKSIMVMRSFACNIGEIKSLQYKIAL